MQAVLLTNFFLSLFCVRGVTLHVATNGNDAWSGTLSAPNAKKTDGPFATLTRVRDRIRELKSSDALTNAVTVFVHGGVYSLLSPLKFEAADSGTSNAPVVFRNYEREHPIVIGGRAITNFTPYTNGIFMADVATQGFRGIYFRQLIFDGRRQHLARYPNFDPANPYGGGWAYADGKFVPMYSEVPGEDRHSFTCKTNDLRTWAHPEEVEVFVFPRYNWWNNICQIKSLDAATRQITLAQDASYAIRPGDRYYFRNALEELDAPGEWYLDRRTGTLYFYPPVPLKGRAVYAPTLRTLLELGPGTSHVTFRGFTFECAEGNAIVLNQTTNCLIAASIIRNVGDYNGSGVSINGGSNNGVFGCDIHDVGRHAIAISGGDTRTLTPANNFAENNYIHHTGVFYKQGVGVELDGVGNRAAHNLIHDCPRFGIGFHGNNLVIEYNYIHHVDLETADTGAVYTGGRDWLGSRGTVIRYNYFHDILGYGFENGRWQSPHFAWGIYLDDNTGGVDVIGNVAVRAMRGLIHLHNGRDNRIENNILVDGTLQQIECNGWTRDSRMWKDHLPTMIAGYESVMNEPAWHSMRNMNLHPTNAVLANGLIMSGNTFVRNVIAYHAPDAQYTRFRNFPFDHNQCDSNLVWHYGQPIRTGNTKTNDWADWQALGMDRHSIVADPLFVNSDKDNYQLKPNSPAFKLGFKPIPFEKIGPYASELRATWPIVEAEGAREKPLSSLEVPPK